MIDGKHQERAQAKTDHVPNGKRPFTSRCRDNRDPVERHDSNRYASLQPVACGNLTQNCSTGVQFIGGLVHYAQSEQGLKGEDVLKVLNQIKVKRGVPRMLHCDTTWTL